MAESMVFDRRPIKTLWWDDVEGTRCMVGEAGVTKIEAYFESQDTWLEVYVGDEVRYRVPSWKVTVEYFIGDK